MSQAPSGQVADRLWEEVTGWASTSMDVEAHEDRRVISSLKNRVKAVFSILPAVSDALFPGQG